MPTSDARRASDGSILLAVEHQISAELLADRLTRMDLTVERVTNGHQAEDVMKNEGCGVAVVEARLAGRTGLELVRRRPAFDPPIVLLGRRGNDDEVVRAFELGAADYITRPFSPRIATARIRRFYRLKQDTAPAAFPHNEPHS